MRRTKERNKWRDARVVAHVTEETRARMIEDAREMGISVSSYANMLLLHGLKVERERKRLKNSPPMNAG